MHILAIGVAVGILAACASQGKGRADIEIERSKVDLGWNEEVLHFDVDAETGSSSDTVFLSAAAAWEALPQSYSEQRLLVGALEPAGRTLRAQMRVRRELGTVRISRILTCGSGAGASKADTYNIFLTVTTRIDSVTAEKSVLRTYVTGSGHDPTVVGNRVQCTSTGWLEPRIADEVQAGRR